jgi:carbonic anhydrase
MRRLVLAALICTAPAFAEPPRPSDAAVSLLGQLLADNARFVKDHDHAAFTRWRDDQHPRATVVACADSRFQSRDIESAPEGDLFEVRNIGNQIDTAPGSVEYGVRHLHTPVLLVVGHVGCGAVKAALLGYGSEHLEVRRELDGLHNSLRGVPDGPLETRWPAGVRANVYTQVDYALAEYAPEVKSGALTIVGALYDFRDELKGGEGKLHIIDVNGERDAKKIAELPLVKAASARVK